MAPRPLSHPLATFVLSLGVAATLGALIYFVTSALPFLALTPTTDATFGRANACLAQTLPGPRLGFAISPDAGVVAAISGQGLALCEVHDGGLVLHQPRGGRALGYDGLGRLWLDRGPEGLERLDDADGGVAVRALVGTAFGVVVLQEDGHLVSMAELGEVMAIAERVWPLDSKLSVSSDGERLALTTSGGVSVHDARTLAALRTEAPCAVERASWLPGTRRLWLTCGPDAEGGLVLDAETGARDEVAKAPPAEVSPAPSGVWVVGCEGLPCTVPVAVP